MNPGSAAAVLAGFEAAGDGARFDLRASAGVDTIVLGLSKDPNPKLTVLLFRPGSAAPWAVAKVPTTAAARRAVEREKAVLEGARQAFPRRALRGVPRRLPELEPALPAGSMAVEALPGSPLAVRYARRGHLRDRRAVRTDLDAVASWLCMIQEATVQSIGPIELCRPVASAVASRFGDDPVARRVAGCVDALDAVFAAHVGPKTLVHGDLWLANVLCSQHGVSGAVDWESADICGEPLRDVGRFALSYALYLDRHTRPGRRVRGHGVRAAGWGAGVEYLVSGRGWFPDALRDFLRGSLSRLGADPATWRELIVVALAEVGATADDEEWARRHVRLADSLLARGGPARRDGGGRA